MNSTETLWIDTHEFYEHGGWKLDTQFTHLAGGSCLLAAGAGRPVADARHQFSVHREGRYRLWVLDRNWLPEHSPGRFRVSLGYWQSPVELGCERVFGASESGEWTWEDGGVYHLAPGKLCLALHDVTGYYGRCAALLLTTDIDYRPPSGAAEVLAERLGLKPLPPAAQAGPFDLVVAGAGIAGVCAALAAARMGLSTALIQDRPVTGGNASEETGVTVNGAASRFRHARESGILGELQDEKNAIGHPCWTRACDRLLGREERLTVLRNTRVTGVRMDGDSRIAAVRTIDAVTGAPGEYESEFFADTTGDGWVGFHAGAEYRMGREARSEFDEKGAPESADGITMSGCIMDLGDCGFVAEPLEGPQPYEPPPWAPRLEFGPGDRRAHDFRRGMWWMEHRGEVDDLEGAERARDELLRITFGYWDWIKNRWAGRRQAGNFRLVKVPLVNARRESRRLVGDYVLNQNDVMADTRFPDRVSYGGWGVDIHHPEGIYGREGNGFDYNLHPGNYTIPFRCLYSRNVDNLFLGGRAVSVTHSALGTVRIQATLGTLGQVVGTAAALCRRRATDPRGLYREHIDELQQTLLEQDQYIPDLAGADPEDLARRAAVSASSTQTWIPAGKGHLDLRRARGAPGQEWEDRLRTEDLGGRLDVLHLYCAADDRSEVTVEVFDGEPDEDDSPAATATTEVPAHHEGWVDLRLESRLRSPTAVLKVRPGRGVQLFGADRPFDDCPSLACATTPELRRAADLKPRNVLSGITRPVGENWNMWVSDGRQPLPQHLDLEWDGPVEISRVQLIFDTDTNSYRMGTKSVGRRPFYCVRDYRLEVPDGDGWRVLASETGNYHRRRVHRFETVTTRKLRLRVLATNGDPSARVFEVRAWS